MDAALPLSDNVPDLSGKVALVTGANSSGGMGFHIAYQMASKGAKVYVGARSPSKARAAVDEMKRLNPTIGSGMLAPFAADMGHVRSVRDAARALCKSESRLDLLVHNAAIISAPLDINEDGISVLFATNHFGPFVLTCELMPLLRRAADITHDARVVAVAASSYKFFAPGVRFDSLDRFNEELEPSQYGGADFSRYSRSKLANILFARELQNKFDAAGTSAVSMSLHPGLIKTDGVVRSFLDPKLQRTIDGRLSPAEGAVTALFAATSPAVSGGRERYGGAFLQPPGVIDELVGDAASDELARELWDTSERIVRGILEG